MAEECHPPDELRTRLLINWERGTRPGAEVIQDEDGRPFVVLHSADGSDYELSYSDFIKSAKESFRQCRRDSTEN